MPALHIGHVPVDTCAHPQMKTEIQANVNVAAPVHASGCVLSELDKYQHRSKLARIAWIALHTGIPEKHKQDC